MKKLIIFLSLCLVATITFGQNSLKVEYDVISNFTYKTTAILKTHNNQSHYLVLKYDNNQKEVVVTTTDDGDVNISVPDSDNRPQVFIDLNTKSLISIVPMFKKNNVLKESLPKIDWELKNEFKAISNFNCQKAIGYFRGRKYTVWFSTDIPLPFGPWKLQGLPGLVIEAKDDKNQFYFRASKIESLNNLKMDDFTNEDKAIPLKKFIDEVIPNKFKEFESLINSKSDRNTTFSLSLPNRNQQKEIIYEWEEQTVQN